MIVIVGSLVALFKIPTVEYNGLVDDPHGAPRFKVDDVLAPTAFEINLGFNMGVINPNIESAHFESLKATVTNETRKGEISMCRGLKLIFWEVIGIRIHAFPFSHHLGLLSNRPSSACGRWGGH